MLTDSAFHSNMIANSSKTTERRLIIYIAATLEAYNNVEIYDIGWLKKTDNIADAFTKIVVNEELNTLLDDGQLKTTVF